MQTGALLHHRPLLLVDGPRRFVVWSRRGAAGAERLELARFDHSDRCCCLVVPPRDAPGEISEEPCRGWQPPLTAVLTERSQLTPTISWGINASTRTLADLPSRFPRA